MTLAEYMDPARFPETTQAGLTPQRQLLIDAFNFDQLREYLEFGGQLDDEQTATLRELEEKMTYQSAMIAAMMEQEGPNRSSLGVI